MAWGFPGPRGRWPCPGNCVSCGQPRASRAWPLIYKLHSLDGRPPGPIYVLGLSGQPSNSFCAHLLIACWVQHRPQHKYSRDQSRSVSLCSVCSGYHAPPWLGVALPYLLPTSVFLTSAYILSFQDLLRSHPLESPLVLCEAILISTSLLLLEFQCGASYLLNHL